MRVWAYHSSLGSGGSWSAGNGWRRVLRFSTLDDLLRALDAAQLQGGVDTLAIVAHGATQASSIAGEVHVSPVLSASSLSHPPVAALVQRLQNFLRAQGNLVFMSCRAGAGVEGTQLLCAVSTLLPRRAVRGYVSYGYIGPGIQAAGNVTDTLIGSIPRNLPVGYPRVFEGCPSEKVARDGRIERGPDIRGMWEQLEHADPDFAGRILDAWLREGSRVTRRRFDPTLDWDRPPTLGYDYEYVNLAPAASVEEHYARAHIRE